MAKKEETTPARKSAQGIERMDRKYACVMYNHAMYSFHFMHA